MATRVDGKRYSNGYVSVIPFFYYTISETATTYTLTLYGGLKSENSAEVGGAEVKITGTGQSEKKSSLFSLNGAKDYIVITSFTWSWNKTKSTQSKTVTLAFGFLNSSFVMDYASYASYSASKSFTIPAKPSYAITYNANGGTGAPADQTKWHGEDITLQSGIPTRSGYRFLGWATSQGGAVAYQPSAAYTVNSPLTLYAVWEAYYTYTINTTRVNASGDIIEDPNGEWIYIKANLTTEEYTNNPLNAYHFKDNGATKTVGWYKNSNKTNSVSYPYQPTANSFILYAWYHADTEKHELSFQFDTNHTTGKVISVIVPPIFRTMDFLAGGKGVAIGKRATKTGMEIAMPVTIEDKSLTVTNNTLYQKNTTVDLKEANNNVSANTYLAFVYRDKNNKEQGRFGFGTFPDGRTRTEMTVRNYDANGNQVASKGFSISMDKTGNVTYGVTQPEKLRATLSLQEFIDLNAILRDGVAPALSMTNWTTVNCSGSITTWLSNACSGYCIKLSGRIAITNFSRTGSNAGASCQFGVKPKKAISKVVGFRAESPREIVYVDVNTNGLATFRTSESYTNASGSTLTLIIPNWIVNFNN